MTDAAVLDLSGAQPYPSTAARRVWQQAANAAAAEPDAWQTAPPAGDPALVEQIAAWCGVPADELAITAGVRAASARLAVGTRRVLVEAPTFAGVPETLTDLGCEVSLVPWDDLPSEQERVEPDLVWLTAPCRNPDGATIDAATLERIAAAPGRLVINETYRWFAPPPAQVSGCLSVGGFHKLLGGGARVGWIHDPTGQRPSASQRASSPARLLQRTWAWVIRTGGLDALLSAATEPVQAARAAFHHALGVTDAGGSAAPFLLLAVAPHREEVAILARLHRAGVRVGAGSAFHTTLPSIRVCFTSVTTAEAYHAGQLIRPYLDRGELLLTETDQHPTHPATTRPTTVPSEKDQM